MNSIKIFWDELKSHECERNFLTIIPDKTLKIFVYTYIYLLRTYSYFLPEIITTQFYL